MREEVRAWRENMGEKPGWRKEDGSSGIVVEDSKEGEGTKGAGEWARRWVSHRAND